MRLACARVHVRYSCSESPLYRSAGTELSIAYTVPFFSTKLRSVLLKGVANCPYTGLSGVDIIWELLKVIQSKNIIPLYQAPVYVKVIVTVLSGTCKYRHEIPNVSLVESILGVLVHPHMLPYHQPSPAYFKKPHGNLPLHEWKLAPTFPSFSCYLFLEKLFTFIKSNSKSRSLICKLAQFTLFTYCKVARSTGLEFISLLFGVSYCLLLYKLAVIVGNSWWKYQDHHEKIHCVTLT